jgi:hypothetical protein
VEAREALAATFHGPAMHQEIALYVREVGLDAAAALRAATVAGADLVRRPDLGRIAAGALGDLVIVDGDPLVDVEAIARVAGVVRAGVPLDPARLELERTPIDDVAPPCAEALCAAGYQCDLVRAVCYRLCDPLAAEPACEPGEVCADLGGMAGLDVGACRNP